MSNTKINKILEKSLSLEFIGDDEALYLYENASLSELIFYANALRNVIHRGKVVTYIIDRNINLTNICSSQCKFCNFYRDRKSQDAYVLSMDEYVKKIDELYDFGGNQILLQGGMNPILKIDFYRNLFKDLKNLYPDLKIHALGPPEIAFIAKISGKSIQETLTELRSAGLSSLPGAGAEILSDRVRKILSPHKCSTEEWLEVMRVAHQLGMTCSATMMFGHVETIQERIEHIIKIRDLQAEKPAGNKGFISFTLWPFASYNTELIKQKPDIKHVLGDEFLRMLAISRLLLVNVPNIQASWLTMGMNIGQISLHCGANDMSSIMIEENVVSQAGKNYSLNEEKMRQVISKAGFVPMKRNQEYELV